MSTSCIAAGTHQTALSAKALLQSYEYFFSEVGTHYYSTGDQVWDTLLLQSRHQETKIDKALLEKVQHRFKRLFRETRAKIAELHRQAEKDIAVDS